MSPRQPTRDNASAAETELRASARELERMRRLARRASLEDLDREEVWLDEDAATTAVAAFDRVHLAPDLRLVTYMYRERAGGNGWTFAVPATDAPPPADALFDPSRFGFSRPPGALSNLIEALEPEGGLRSFLQLSILLRELDELGAWWHGIEWGTHALIGQTRDRDRGFVSPGYECGGPFPTELGGESWADEDWTWSESAPSDWRPSAERTSSEAVVVNFWTMSDLAGARIYAHRDVYSAAPEGAKMTESDRREIASGPGGFIF